MTLRALRAAALLCGVLAASACGESRERRAAPQVGAPAPDYRAVSIEGEQSSLAELRGSVVLLNVWATWCAPCRDEIPVLQRLHERFSPEGLVIVGVSVDARGEEHRIARFASEFGMTYPIWLDPDERVSTAFMLVGVPGTYLIGRDGTLLWRHVGPVREGDPGFLRALEGALGDELERS